MLLDKWLRHVLRWRRAGIIGLLILIIIVFGVFALVRLYNWVQPRGATELTTFIQTVAQTTGGAVLLCTIWIGFRNMHANAQQTYIAEQGQITERFTNAIEQLASTSLTTKLGGIYALERIARDSCKGNQNGSDWGRDHLSVMEVLTAYVRTNSLLPPTGLVSSSVQPSSQLWDGQRLSFNSHVPDSPQVSADIQAILTVIGRRSQEQRRAETSGLDLSGTDLAGANLRGCNLQRIDFSGSDLSHTCLVETNMSAANFTRSNLRGAALSHSNLVKSNCTFANLAGADLAQCDLTEATLLGATLFGVNLHGADMDGADLSGTLGLTTYQIIECRIHQPRRQNRDNPKAAEINQPT